VTRLGRRAIALIPRRECSVQVEMTRTRHAIIVVRRDTSLQIASSPSREDPPPKTSKYKNQVMMRRTTIRARTRVMRRKGVIIRRPRSSQRRKGKT
jgi:septum formation inhibitor MinC